MSRTRYATGRRQALRLRRGIALLVVLVFTLIVTLAALALVRKALVTATASGSIAVRHNLALAGLAAVDASATTLGGAALPDAGADAPAENYFASREAGENTAGIPAALLAPGAYPPGARTLTAGDLTIRYVIERLCTERGAAAPERCTLPPPAIATAAAPGAPSEPPLTPYYRISARIDAPDGSTGYAQAMLGPGATGRRLAWWVVDEP